MTQHLLEHIDKKNPLTKQILTYEYLKIAKEFNGDKKYLERQIDDKKQLTNAIISFTVIAEYIFKKYLNSPAEFFKNNFLLETLDHIQHLQEKLMDRLDNIIKLIGAEK